MSWSTGRCASCSPPEDARSTEHLRAFIANGYRLEAVESHQLGRDGRPRVFRSSLVGVVEDGWLRRAWGTQRDVTAEVEAREQAEAGNRAKDEFLALLGHELRNPLSPILTALELMQMRDPGALARRARDHRAAGRARGSPGGRSARRLAHNPRDGVAGAQAGSTSRRWSNSAIELASPLIEQRAHRLSVDLPPGLVVDGDPLRLAQVFANLLTNAAKYTPREGVITIAGAREGDARASR